MKGFIVQLSMVSIAIAMSFSGVNTTHAEGVVSDDLAGAGSGYVTSDGSIFINLSNVVLYEVFVGSNTTPSAEEYKKGFNGDIYVMGVDVLHLDAGLSEPHWAHFVTLKQNRVENHADENFAEVDISIGNIITASNLDTGVNVESLPAGVNLWLAYQTVGNVPEFDPIYGFYAIAVGVPEPGTFLMVALCLLGLVLYGWRGRIA